MTEMQRIRADGLADLFHEHGIIATAEQIQQISDDFYAGIELEREHAYYVAPYKDPAIDQMKNRISELERQVEKERSDFRKNVARRRNCDPNDVTLLGDGNAEFHY